MRIVALAFGSALLALTPSAFADPPAPALAPASAPPSASPAGLAVLALSGATDAAWPLAQAVYDNALLRPASLDDASARVLCGEPVTPAAPSSLRDLADSVAAVHGDDAPSRAVLDAIARRFAVRGVVVVTVDSGHATARAYLPDTNAFDAARYAPDAGGTQWTAAAQSLARSFAGPAPSSSSFAPSGKAPALATHAEPPAPAARPTGRAFWQSGWFWGAVGAAAFGAGAAYFVTRDNTGSTIHLELQVPH